MITTIVLVRADPQHIPDTARAIAGIDGVQEVYSVSGEWDLVVIVKVAEYQKIAEVVTEKFPAVKGIERTDVDGVPGVFAQRSRTGVGHRGHLRLQASGFRLQGLRSCRSP